MPINRSPRQISRARSLRKNMTDGERRLWQELRQFQRLYGVHARKQVPIGPYVVDFAIVKMRIVIELDGESHFTPDGMKKDTIRDAHLAKLGYRVLRINTGELSENFNDCIETMLRELKLT